MHFSSTVRADRAVASCMASGCTRPPSTASWYQRAAWTSGSGSASRSSSGSSIKAPSSASLDVELEAVDLFVAGDAQRAIRALGRSGHLELVGDLLEVADLGEPVLLGRLG